MIYSVKILVAPLLPEINRETELHLLGGKLITSILKVEEEMTIF